MKNMTLENIAKACGGILWTPPAKECLDVVKGVVIDSRQVEQGYLFIAVKGERVDGHSFIDEVFQKGACAVVCEKMPSDPQGPCIKVADSLKALREIAAFYRAQLKDLKVVGITGSVGKTTTKEFVAAVLEKKYAVLKTEGNYNNEIGVPLTVLKIREEHQVAVLEMGINHFGEMHRLSKIAGPDICLITNIGQCHLEYLGSRDGILKAKSEIFDHMAENGLAVVNGDDDKLATLHSVKGKKPVTYGLSSACDLYASDCENLGLAGSRFTMHLQGKTMDVSVPLPGGHMIYNALAAAAVACILDVSLEQIREGISDVQAVGGRDHVIVLPDKTLIDDCYNANPVSMQAAIDLLVTAKGRTVAILGDMFELGEDEKQLHGQVGSYAAARGVDLLLCVGELSRYLFEAAQKSGADAHHFEKKEDLVRQLPALLKKNDTILLKASHGMAFSELIDKIKAMQPGVPEALG